MKKPKAELCVIADYSMIDSDKKISVIGIFNRLSASKFPTNHPKMSFVSTLVYEAGAEEEFKVIGRKKSGEDIFSGEIKITFGPNAKSHLNVDLIGITFPESGEYEFIVKWKDSIIAKSDLLVEQKD